ncbi:MAG: hypothetical protein ABJM29_16945 [Rhizobiaceae bacterium]
MFGTIFFAGWGCIITAATLVVGMNMQAETRMADEQEMVVELPPVFTQPQQLVAPIVTTKRTKGYVFSNVSLELDATLLSQMSLPLDMVLQDGYLALIVGNPDFNFPETSQFELMKFKAGLKDGINAFVDGELVRDVYVSGINFLGTDEARRKQTLRSVWLQDPDNPAPPPEPKK